MISGKLSVTFKASKPSFSVTIDVDPTDSISHIKQLIADSHPTAPPPAAQRLVLKGKALLDNKLLKEYNVSDGAIINIMVKSTSTTASPIDGPGQTQASTGTVLGAFVDSAASGVSDPEKLTPAAHPSPRPSSGSHQRKMSDIPAVVLSPAQSGPGTPLLNVTSSPSSTPIPLDLNSLANPQPSQTNEDHSTYHETIANPEYWQKLYTFLSTQFVTQQDTDNAFEEILLGSKTRLSAHEIAKIRDSVGITGMAGL